MIDQYPPANGVLTSLIWRKTATGGETSLSGYDNASQALSYTPGQEQVYLNGILLVRGSDYTATNGTSITGLSALAADDFVQINCYNNFSLATLPAASITGTIANNQLQNSSITINGSPISLGGSVSLPGDIESVTAGTGLSGGGNSGSVTLSINTSVTADLSTSQTLTNKTLTSPVITTPTLTLDSTTSTTNGRMAWVQATDKIVVGDGTNAVEFAPSTILFNAQTGTTYTFVLTDKDRLVTASNGSAQAYSVPTNASVAYPVGTQINIIQIGAGQVTISASTPATTTILSTGATAASPKLRAQYSSATLIKAATDTWYVVGDIA